MLRRRTRGCERNYMKIGTTSKFSTVFYIFSDVFAVRTDVSQHPFQVKTNIPR